MPRKTNNVKVKTLSVSIKKHEDDTILNNLKARVHKKTKIIEGETKQPLPNHYALE